MSVNYVHICARVLYVKCTLDSGFRLVDLRPAAKDNLEVELSLRLVGRVTRDP